MNWSKILNNKMNWFTKNHEQQHDIDSYQSHAPLFASNKTPGRMRGELKMVYAIVDRSHIYASLTSMHSSLSLVPITPPSISGSEIYILSDDIYSDIYIECKLKCNKTSIVNQI